MFNDKLYQFLISIFILLPTCAFSENAGSTLSPPGFYIDTEKPCPFECCSYGDWTVDASTAAYEKTDTGSKVTGKFQEGNIVTVTKGEIHVKPGKFIVKKVTRNNPRLFSLPEYKTRQQPSDTIKPGDILYLYSYLGEGYYKIWFKGDFYTDSIIADGIDGEIIEEPKSTWWVYATSPKGWSGWADPYRFGNNSGCPDAYPWNIRIIYNTENKKIRTQQEINNYRNLINQLNELDQIKVVGNGYSHGNYNGSMYIDLFVDKIWLMDIQERTAAVKELVNLVYGYIDRLGFSNRVKIEAQCDHCEKIIINRI